MNPVPPTFIRKMAHNIHFFKALMGIALFSLIGTVFGQTSSINSKDDDRLFRHRVPKLTVLTKNTSTDLKLINQDGEKLNLYDVPVKVYINGKLKELSHTRSGKVTFNFSELKDSDKIKIKVGKFKINKAKFKKNIIKSRVGEMRDKNIEISTGKRKKTLSDILFPEPICPQFK